MTEEPRPIPLLRIDGSEEVRLPNGVCEIWRGIFDSERRVEILACEAEEKIPGLRHYIGYISGSREVTGTFHVPCGYTMADVKLL